MARTSAQYEGRPLLDIASYARRGPGRRDRLPQAEMAIIARTLRRTPEVMIKVSGGGASLKAVQAHVKYIDRHGKLDIETDDGERLQGKGVERELLDGWDLGEEIDEAASPYTGKSGRRPGKLVHNIILSMPSKTPPDKLLAATKDFAREQFALKNRYAMVLHTDQQHPHVHLVVKAMGENGERLNIRKATLREWRSEFARHLREHGVEANATERQVRDQGRAPKRDGLYRAELRGDSRRQQAKASVAGSIRSGGSAPPETSNTISAGTRRAVLAGWEAIAQLLRTANRRGEAVVLGADPVPTPPPDATRSRTPERGGR